MPTMRRAICLVRWIVARAIALERTNSSSRLDIGRPCGYEGNFACSGLWIAKGFASIDQTVDDACDHNEDEYGGQRRIHVVVEHDAAHLGKRLSWSQDLPGGSGFTEFERMANESDSRIGTEDLFEAGRHGGDHEPDGRDGSDPGEAFMLHLE